jgi:hypothetical protein
MKYEDLNVIAKIWYFLLLVPIVIVIILLSLLILSFIVIAKIFKFVKLTDAIKVWGNIIISSFMKRFKDARTRKEN